jgi:hypothetical protein
MEHSDVVVTLVLSTTDVNKIKITVQENLGCCPLLTSV